LKEAAARAQRLAPGDPARPGREAAPVVEASRLEEDAQEHVLHEVLAVRGRDAEPAREALHPGRRAEEELLEGLRITHVDEAPQQSAVGEEGGLSDRQGSALDLS
jgi:hypothetical protein